MDEDLYMPVTDPIFRSALVQHSTAYAQKRRTDKHTQNIEGKDVMQQFEHVHGCVRVLSPNGYIIGVRFCTAADLIMFMLKHHE